jgi:hypothetical protein
MPLPLKNLRVLPNPWTLIHVEKGPQGAFPMDSSGRTTAPLRFLGATRVADPQEKREVEDPRGQNNKATFSYALDEALTNGAPILVPAASAYYRDALRDGDIVPADAATAGAVECKFASLKEARAAGIAAFESHYGNGSFEEAFGASRPALLGKAPTKSDKAANPKTTTSSDGGSQ